MTTRAFFNPLHFVAAAVKRRDSHLCSSIPAPLQAQLRGSFGIAFLAVLSLTALDMTELGRAQNQEAPHGPLRQSLTFHASFDHGTDADFALGDGKIRWAPTMKHPRIGSTGLPESGVVTHAQGEGRFGGALRFHKKAPEIVFYRGEKNIAYQPKDWGGSVSLWLKVDPQKELAPSFCDPIQITPREWNDAAFFVEFEKRTNSIPFRLGAYADFKVWNPENREWAKIPIQEKPLLAVEKPPFSGDRWTHVAFTFANFNSGRKDGVAKLYLNGDLQGAIGERQQTFTWDPSQALIMLGLSYVGLYDEVSIFNRALTDQEIKTLFQLTEGVSSLK